MRIIILIVLFLGISLGQLDQNTIGDILAIHNIARENVYPPALNPIQPLTWSTQLASQAASLASTCSWNHSQLYYYSVVGETLGWSYTDDILTQIQGWADTGSALFDIIAHTCYADQYWPYCDRYTQMIWSTTQYVGCAVQTCFGGGMGWNFTVCQYSRPGNYPGVPPYQVDPAYLPTIPATSAPATTAPTPATSAVQTSKAPATSAVQTSQAPATSAAQTSKAPATSAQATSKPVTSSGSTTGSSSGRPPATGSFDWRNYNGVGPIKNQGACGCCWSFAATGAVESAYQIKYGVSLDLSEQELVDCVTSSIGCNGGIPRDALVYMQTNGAMLETSDPYKAAYSGQCTLNKNALASPKITNIIDVQNTQNDLINALRNYGPVIILVGMADQAVWQSYKRGTIQCPANAQIDHAVLAIGWSQENNYFIGKNQWSTQWGMNGFFYLDATQNCGIFQYTTQTVTVA